jgi:tyrosyl-tRNA synthetase
LEKEHDVAPNLRVLQKALAKDITIRVHGEEEYNSAVEASEILFGKGTTDTLKKLDSETFLSVFEGVPTFEVSKEEILQGVNVIDLLAEKTQILASKGEVRRALKENSLSVNKEKVKEDFVTSNNDLLNAQYILVQKGKKNYFIIVAK